MALINRKPKNTEYDEDVVETHASPMAANSRRIMITRRNAPRPSNGNSSSNTRS